MRSESRRLESERSDTSRPGGSVEGYVDIYLLPVPETNLEAYRQQATTFGTVAKEHGGAQLSRVSRLRSRRQFQGPSGGSPDRGRRRIRVTRASRRGDGQGDEGSPGDRDGRS